LCLRCVKARALLLQRAVVLESGVSNSALLAETDDDTRTLNLLATTVYRLHQNKFQIAYKHSYGLKADGSPREKKSQT